MPSTLLNVMCSACHKIVRYAFVNIIKTLRDINTVDILVIFCCTDRQIAIDMRRKATR
jgi:hypothetical protein